jgi:hypothetical protein
MQESPVYSIIFSADSRIFASQCSNETKIWAVDSADLVQRFTHGSHEIGALISFSDDKSSVCTERGTLNLNAIAETDLDLFTYHSHALSASALSIVRDWIVRGDKGLLWLPPDYRPDEDHLFFRNDRFFKDYYIHENTVVLGHNSGHVTIIKFDPEAENGVDVDRQSRRKGIDDADSDREGTDRYSSTSDPDTSEPDDYDDDEFKEYETHEDD